MTLGQNTSLGMTPQRPQKSCTAMYSGPESSFFCKRSYLEDEALPVGLVEVRVVFVGEAKEINNVVFCQWEKFN